MMVCRLLRYALAFFVLSGFPVYAQQVFQSGGVVYGHGAFWKANGTVADAGPAGGTSSLGQQQELGLIAPPLSGTAAPWAASGTGPNGENACLWDAPVGTVGRHYLCLSPNLGSGTGAITALSAFNLDIGVTQVAQVTPTGITSITQPGSSNNTFLATTAYVDRAVTGGSGIPIVTTNALLATTPITSFANGVWRLDYAVGNGAPPLYYRPQTGTCAANHYPNTSVSGVNDGGSCTNTVGGNSWIAAWDDTDFDVREFGAKADGTTANDTAFAAAKTYADAVGGCAVVPNPGGVFKLNSELDIDGCLKGVRTDLALVSGSFGTPVLSFPNDTNGIVFTGKLGGYIADLSLKGNAAESSSSTQTIGFFQNGAYDTTVKNVSIQDFVTCRQYSSPSGRTRWQNMTCMDKYAYPNIKNGYPRAATALISGDGSSVVGNGFSDEAAYLEDQSVYDEVDYTGDGATTYFQICAPHTSGTPSGMTVPCTANGGVPATANSWLWSAYAVQVRVGSTTTYGNGFVSRDGVLQTCGVPGQTASYGYAVYDISLSGGSGSGGTLLFCTQTTATLTSGSATIVVPSTTAYQAGSNIMVWGDHGIPLETTVLSIVDGTHLLISNQASESGTANLIMAQIAVATSGSSGGYSQACQALHTCGYKIEVRFASAPANTSPVAVQWINYTGAAAYDIEAGGDGIYLRPDFVGGFWTGVKNVTTIYSSVFYQPNYIELQNQCVSHEGNAGSGVYVMQHWVNPFITRCGPYGDYVSSSSPSVVDELNGQRKYFGVTAGPGAKHYVFQSTPGSYGNGADTTEDTLITTPLPANSLFNINDVFDIKACGFFASSADNKVAKLYFGSESIATPTVTTGAPSFCLQMRVVRTSPGHQQLYNTGLVGTTPVALAEPTGTETETSPITVKLTGQDSSASTANAVVGTYLFIEKGN